MITLVTGGPGTGKTAWLLNQLLNLRVAEPDRLFFIHGVRNLRGIAHETIYCRSQLCDICRGQDADIEARLKTSAPPKFVEDWPKWKEPNSLIVVDEVQRIWRPTNGAQGVHESISTLETHRHYGVDFWLISQGPHLFHNFIRLLVGRHVHLVAKWSGRTEYEWPECKQDVQSRSDAVQRPYTLPKRVYDLYDSAEVHTKQDKRKPLSFYAVIALVLLTLIVVPFIGKRIYGRAHPDDAVKSVETPNSTNSQSIQSIDNNKVSTTTSEQLQTAYTPVVIGVPWSAPIYKDLAKPVSMPRIVGCIKSNKADDHRCACYTQQATLVEVSADVCNLYVQHRAFDPFIPDKSNQSASGIDSKNMIATNGQ